MSATPIVVGGAETVTVTVSSAGAGSPTGTVSFLDGTTALGSATLTNGQASFTTNALTVGVHTLNTSYSGDTNFASSNGSASVTVTAAPTDFTFATGGTTTQTVQAGQVATYSFSLTPTAGGYPAAVTFTVSGLPSGATAAFTPSSIPANGTAQTVTLKYPDSCKGSDKRWGIESQANSACPGISTVPSSDVAPHAKAQEIPDAVWIEPADPRYRLGGISHRIHRVWGQGNHRYADAPDLHPRCYGKQRSSPT